MAEARQGQTDQYMYRGHSIEIQIAPETEALESGLRPSKLLIDGREIPFDQADSGVISPEAMFIEFGTPYELAEHLIREWGTATIENPSGSHHHQQHASGGTKEAKGSK